MKFDIRGRSGGSGTSESIFPSLGKDFNGSEVIFLCITCRVLSAIILFQCALEFVMRYSWFDDDFKHAEMFNLHYSSKDEISGGLNFP